MTRKSNKFAQDPDRRMKGRKIHLPADLPEFERTGVDFVASIFALAHAENPDEDWLSKCQPWVRAAAERKRISH